jgi:hypothetical protein
VTEQWSELVAYWSSEDAKVQVLQYL